MKASLCCLLLVVLLAGCVMPTPRPTRTPYPTWTPRPTATTAPTPTPMTPEEALRYNITQVFGSRLGDLETKGHVGLGFAIRDGFTQGLVNDGAKAEIAQALRIMAESDLDIESVTLDGWFPMQDAYGNEENVRVIHVVYSRETVARINWDNFRAQNVLKIADQAQVHPEFE